MRDKHRALARFLAVGAVTAAASALGIVALVRYARIAPLPAAAIVAVVGNLWGFVVNRQWSFLVTRGNPWLQLVRYLAVAAAATCASVALFAVLHRSAGMHYVLASIVVSVTFALANFLAHFHWSFRDASLPRSES